MRITTGINSVFESPECGTVLVVENSSLKRMLWRNTLTQFGYRVMAVGSADQAMCLIESQELNLIISDVNAPGLNGLELLTTVKADPEFASIPFVFISSTFAENKERLVGFLLGADGFIEGPVDAQALLNGIQQYLNTSETSH